MTKKLLSILLVAGLSTAYAQNNTQQNFSTSGVQTGIIGGAQPIEVPVRNLHELREIPEGTPIMPPNAAKARQKIKARYINLNTKGEAVLSGTVRGLGMATYQFEGQAGDVIDIISSKSTAMEFAIFRPEMGMRFGNHQVLPESGTYELRIVNNRKNSAYDKTPRPYRVTFRLTRKGL